MSIFLTSDLHLCHNREFIYGPRGFTNVEDHDETIVRNWNNVVSSEDDVYILGDLMLNDNENGIKLLKQLNGRKHIILGNHDTAIRERLYLEEGICVEPPKWADILHYKGYHFYLSHFPAMTGNLEKESLKQVTINLFGHTHQKEQFYQDIPFMFHVGLDSNNNTPVLLDNIIELCKAKVIECQGML